MYELKDYLNAINYTKEKLLDSDDETWKKKYPPYIVNKCLAPHNDTIMLVNEINMRHHLDKKLQFDFLLNSIRKRKRFEPYVKSGKIKDIEYVKEYYEYSNEKAKTALKILTKEQITTIRKKLNKGGRK